MPIISRPLRTQFLLEKIVFMAPTPKRVSTVPIIEAIRASHVPMGRAKQLICNGFTKTGLIEGIKEFEQILASLKVREAHYVFDSEHPLPKRTRKPDNCMIKAIAMIAQHHRE